MTSVMDRRTFLATAAALLAAPLAGWAQQTGKVARIGYLSTGTETANAVLRRAFIDGLREHGMVEGKDIVIESRWEGAGKATLDALAAELVRLPLDLVLATNTPACLAVKRTGTSLPVVFPTVSEPVVIGLVASLARPGGNFTGFTTINRELMGKRLELLIIRRRSRAWLTSAIWPIPGTRLIRFS
jgi:putative ABC transport system substrate-binding protein